MRPSAKMKPNTAPVVSSSNFEVLTMRRSQVHKHLPPSLFPSFDHLPHLVRPAYYPNFLILASHVTSLFVQLSYYLSSLSSYSEALSFALPIRSSSASTTWRLEPWSFFLLSHTTSCSVSSTSTNTHLDCLATLSPISRCKSYPKHRLTDQHLECRSWLLCYQIARVQLLRLGIWSFRRVFRLLSPPKTSTHISWHLECLPRLLLDLLVFAYFLTLSRRHQSSTGSFYLGCPFLVTHKPDRHEPTSGVFDHLLTLSRLFETPTRTYHDLYPRQDGTTLSIRRRLFPSSWQGYRSLFRVPPINPCTDPAYAFSLYPTLYPSTEGFRRSLRCN